MKDTSGTTNYVTQSKYFSPVFNAAIFDGPIRIYFAQHQEAQALKIYFNLQERYRDIRQNARSIFHKRGGNIFIMLYPSQDTFEMCFESTKNTPSTERLGSDYVLGILSGLDESEYEALYQKIDEITQKQKNLFEASTASL